MDQTAVSAGDRDAAAAPAERPGGDPATDERMAVPSEPGPWVARMLARLGMPPDEIGWVLGAKEPLVLGRYFELHRERLTETLAEQLGSLAAVERVLALAMLRRGSAPTDGR